MIKPSYLYGTGWGGLEPTQQIAVLQKMKYAYLNSPSEAENPLGSASKFCITICFVQIF